MRIIVFLQEETEATARCICSSKEIKCVSEYYNSLALCCRYHVLLCLFPPSCEKGKLKLKFERRITQVNLWQNMFLSTQI